MHKYIKIFIVSLMAVLCSMKAGAQDEVPQMDPNEMYQNTQKAIEAYTKRLKYDLKLADWQQFKLDSVLNKTFYGKTKELLDLNMRKVSAANLYQMVSDKWDEQTYEAMREFLTEEQWTRYLKTGAEKEKRQRDKRAAKK